MPLPSKDKMKEKKTKRKKKRFLVCVVYACADQEKGEANNHQGKDSCGFFT